MEKVEVRSNPFTHNLLIRRAVCLGRISEIHSFPVMRYIFIISSDKFNDSEN